MLVNENNKALTLLSGDSPLRDKHPLWDWLENGLLVAGCSPASITQYCEKLFLVKFPYFLIYLDSYRTPKLTGWLTLGVTFHLCGRLELPDVAKGQEGRVL